MRGARRAALLVAMVTIAALVGLAPTAGAATSTFSNATAITIPDATCTGTPGVATPYPSNISVNGLSGTVSDVNVTLTGVTHPFEGDLELLLVGPAGGSQNLTLLSDAGTGALSNATVTFDDSAASTPPQNTAWGPGTYKPVNYTELSPPDVFPSPAPAPSSATTLAGAFGGIAPNGTWSLYVVDDACPDSGSIGGGWSLALTTTDAAASSTSVTSSLNPSRTGQAVTFTATVTSSGAPVTTGTVTFTDGATTLASGVALNGSGQASFSTSALAEGNHVVVATYGGSGSFATSSGSVNQRVDNNTTSTGLTYCNAGAVTINDSSPATPYPSNIFIAGAPSNADVVAVALKNVTHGFDGDIDALLVGPGGQNIVLLSDAGTAAVSNVTVNFADSAASVLPQAGSWAPANTSIMAKPTNYSELTADSFPSAPAPSSATTLSSFDPVNPNGTWSLYVVDDGAPDTGSIAGGWCITLGGDLTPPDTMITAMPANPTNSTSASFSFTGTDSAGGTGVVGFECKLDAGAFAPCTSPKTYTGLSQGSHTFSVRAIDGNQNTDPTPDSYTWTVDTVAPTVTINQAAAQADPTTSAPVTFTAVFSEPVTGLGGTDVTLSGTAGPTTAQVTGGPTTYTVSVSGMTVSGTVTASIPAGAATDAAGNTSTASTSTDDTVTLLLDSTAPDTTLDSTPPDPSTSASASFTFSGTDDDSGVAGFECQLDGGGFAGCTSPQSYSGLAEGSHTFDVRAVDAAGNTDQTPASYTWTIDTVPPTVTIDQAAGQADPATAGPIEFTVTFSEPVTGFTGEDVALSGTAGATTAAVTGGPSVYTVSVSGMTVPGTVVATVAAGAAADAAGNPSAASTSTDNTVTFDDVAPDTSIDTGPGSPVASSSATFSFSGTDSGTGVAGFECSLDGATFAPCTSPKTYAGLADGPHAFSVRAFDGAGNLDPSPASATWTVDTTGPTVTVDQAAGQADPTGAGPITFTVVFSEPVTGFTDADVSLSGTAGATTAVVTGGPTTWSVAVSGMTADGTVTATVPAGAAADAAGNGSAASTSTDDTVTFQFNVAPTVAVVRGGSCTAGGGIVNLAVVDADGDPVTLSAASSNTAVVPLAGISFGGSGTTRTVTVNRGSKTGARSVVTVTASDGTASSSVAITVIVGTNKAETLTGTAGADLILGLNGDDTVDAGAGNDVACSGNGNGTMRGGAGDDTLDGGSGNDVLVGGDGDDILLGGLGQDRLTGGAGADFFSGGAGTDVATDFNAAQGDTEDGTVP